MTGNHILNNQVPATRGSILIALKERSGMTA